MIVVTPNLPVDVRAVDFYTPRSPGTPLSIDYNSGAPTRAEFDAVKAELAAFKGAFLELNQWLVALIAEMPAKS